MVFAPQQHNMYVNSELYVVVSSCVPVILEHFFKSMLWMSARETQTAKIAVRSNMFLWTTKLDLLF